MKRAGATVLFPCHEDVETIIRFRDRLPDDVQVAVPAFEDWNTAEDKLDYVRHVQAAGCPVPDTYEVRSREELDALGERLDFPVVVKTRIGNSAKGVVIVKKPGELKPAFFKLIEEYKLPEGRWPTIQAFVPGKKMGCWVFITRVSTSAASCSILCARRARLISGRRLTVSRSMTRGGCHQSDGVAQLAWRRRYGLASR